MLKASETEGFSRFVTRAEIESGKNNYNLNIPRYIDSSKPDDIQDLSAHVNGGIPDDDIDALSRYWKAFPSLRSTLFEPLRSGYSSLMIEKTTIAASVTANNEYVTFLDDTAKVIADWWISHREEMESIGPSMVPNNLITLLAEDLLGTFRARPLLDEYAVYEQLMSYWNDSMHDDVALIVTEGWAEASTPRPARTRKPPELGGNRRSICRRHSGALRRVERARQAQLNQKQRQPRAPKRDAAR